MAFETITVGTLRTQLARKLCNSDTLDTALTTEVTFAIQAAYRDLVRESRAARFMTAAGTPFTLVTDTATYGLDDDVFMIVEESMRITSSPYTTLQPMLRQEYDAFQGAAITTTGTPARYMIVGASSTTGKLQVTLVPTPGAGVNGKTVSYFKVPTPPTLLGGSDSDTLDKRLPPDWHHFLVVGALRWMPAYLSREEQVQFERMWQQYLESARRTAWPVVGQSEQRERYMAGGYNRLYDRWPMIST